FADHDQFVSVRGYSLYYTDEGPHDGLPVVMLHGAAASSFTWRHQRKALADAGYRVITIDQIGHGASDRPAAPVYTTRLQAELMLGAMDALGINTAHLVGHSYGGRVALQMAIIAPQRILSLVAICPEAFATSRPPIASAVAMPLVGQTLAFYVLAPVLVETGLRHVSRSYGWLTSEAIAGYARPLYVQGTIAAQIWQARSPKDGEQPVPTNLPAITQRTLLLWGSDDPIFPVEHGRQLSNILPNATLQVFDPVGHLPHEEAHDGTTSAILDFLRHP
ncbi:MAG: alpha/beta hydrolase, partial [Chloroflexota bacterium]